MNSSYQPLAGSKKKPNPKPQSKSLDTLPASLIVDPGLLQWARQKELVQPGQDGNLPAMDRGGFGTQSLIWGGPMQTGEASVREKKGQRERRDVAKTMEATGHGEARVVGGGSVDGGADGKQEQARGRKRDMFKKLFQ